jgi:hypothetical protein
MLAFRKAAAEAKTKARFEAPPRFINEHIYEPADRSTYDDPMVRTDRQKDGLRRFLWDL